MRNKTFVVSPTSKDNEFTYNLTRCFYSCKKLSLTLREGHVLPMFECKLQETRGS
jgi:hypothetical protein